MGEFQILIPMAGLIDKQAELARLTKEIERIQKDLPRIEGKLNNVSFVEKAPADVLAKEQEKLADYRSQLQSLEAQHNKISVL